jgi:hypothetical protein
MPREMLPFRPKRTITAVATANGGEITGSSAMMCMNRLNGTRSFTCT